MHADLNQILAANLKFFMGRDGCDYKNPNALAITTVSKPTGYPISNSPSRQHRLSVL